MRRDAAEGNLTVSAEGTMMRRDAAEGNLTVSTEMLKRLGGPTQDGGCPNEGTFCKGNHCVLLKGELLDDFQNATKQDFAPEGQKHTVGNPEEWCVCLHLYIWWGKGGGDDQTCTPEAKEACDD